MGQTISIGDAMITEGDLGQRNAIFTVSREGITPLQVSVDYQTVDGSATVADGDYLPVMDTLIFTGTESRTISVPILGDMKLEPDEMFFVNLFNAQNATILDGEGKGTIFDDDDPPTLSINDVSLAEGDFGTKDATFTVTVTGKSSEPISVRYDTSDGTATVADDDYEPISDTLTIQPMTKSETITISVVSDRKSESDETFFVNLSKAVGATIADGQGQATIIDDDDQPTLSIEDVKLAEGNFGTRDATFTVTLNGKFSEPVTVNYATSDGTATVADDDYQPSSGPLTFQPGGPGSQKLSIQVNGDRKSEPDETFFVQLSEAVGATIVDGQGQATIVDDDDQPTLSIDDVSLSEGDFGTKAAEFTVTATGKFSQPVTVSYATSDGTATVADNDYQPSLDTLMFQPGAPMTQKVTVLVVGDRTAESNETFFVNLSNADGATIIDGQGVGTIRNDDDPPMLSVDDVSLEEGDNGTKSAVFNVSVTGEFSEPVMVRYSTSDGTATVADNDYLSVSDMLTFEPLSSTSDKVVVQVRGDLKEEPDETFFLNLSDAVGAEIADDRGQGTIKNDDEPPTLSISNVKLSEGDSGTTDAVFKVTLTGSSSLRVTVDVDSADGTATVADNDYLSFSETLTFEPGEQAVQMIEISVVGDVKSEPDEMFFVNLTNAQGATITDERGEATIWNDDDGPGLVIDDVKTKEGDSGTVDAVFTVTTIGKFSETVMVSYATEDGTATVSGGDYQAVSGKLKFQPGGESSQRINVPIFGDELAEPDETFFVNLFDAVGAEIEDDQGVAIIQGGDPPPTVSIGDVMIEEGDIGTTPVELTVTVTGAFVEPISVNYSLADGTATVEDNDYAGGAARTLVIQPGQPSIQLMLSINGDTRIEPDETFSVQLSVDPPVECMRCKGTITILNDDEESQFRLISDPSVVESAGMAIVTVERVGAGSDPAKVTVTAEGGTATAGEDFTAISEVLDWGARESGTRSIEVPIFDDNSQEDDETFFVRLSDAEGSILEPPTELELTIVDDDTPMELEPDGEPEIVVEGDEEIELKVRALRDDGQPLQGVVVAWEVSGDAELLDGDTTLTDTEGFATQRVRVGSMSGNVVVTAQIQATDNSVTFEIEVEGVLGENPIIEPNSGEAAVAEVLDESCVEATGEFSQLCDYVFDLGDPADQAEVVEELTPEEASASGTVSRDSPRVQLGNISSRLAALRSGAPRAMDQLTFQFHGGSLGVGQVRTALAKYSQDRDWMAQVLDRAMLAANPSATSVSALNATPQGDGGGGADSPLGFFINGRISAGDRPDSEREAGFDFETLGLTAGVDYGFSDRLVGGLALGYLDTATDINQDGGELDAQGYSLSAFGMYYAGNFFVEGVLSYGLNDYDQVRNIDLPVPFQDQTRFVARSSADGEQLSFGLGVGYEASFGPTSVAGTGSLTWVDADIDGFDEQGAGPFNLRVGEQAIESLQSQARLDVSRAITVQSLGIVIHPAISFAYLHEFRNDSRVIRGSFLEDQTGNTFDVPTEEPDRDFFRVSAGLTAAFVRGRSVFLLYDQDLSRDDLNIYTISFGLRLGL